MTTATQNPAYSHPAVIAAIADRDAAYAAVAAAKTQKAKRLAYENLEFWTIRVAMMTIDNPSNPYRNASR